MGFFDFFKRKKKKDRVIFDLLFRNGAWWLEQRGEVYNNLIHNILYSFTQGFPFTVKRMAIESGRGICRELLANKIQSQLVIRGKDGKIQFEHTYGGDPKRSRG